jgi:transcriptional regulator|tara:strand:+ start:381 stop:800 length:420 start_codon:yes stop_codon:yes gene_type:complete
MNTLEVKAKKIADSFMHKKLTHLENDRIEQILQLANDGKNQREIARALNIHQSSVSRTLSKYMGTLLSAKKTLESGARKLAETVVNTEDSSLALKALGRLNVVNDTPDNGGIQVIIGSPSNIVDGLTPPILLKAKDLGD